MQRSNSNANPNNSYPGLRKVEAALHNLLQPELGESVTIPTSVPFSDLEEKAHTWSTAVVLKYFTLKLELITAYDTVKASNITGLDLLSMSDKYPHPALPNTMHPLHKIKIFLHAQDLREKVINHAKRNRPEALREWDVSHVASWLHIEQGNELASLIAFRGEWAGTTLEDIVKNNGGAREWSQLPPEEQQSLLIATTRLVERDVRKTAEAAATTAQSKSKFTKKKKTKVSTALKTRQIQHAGSIVAGETDDEANADVAPVVDEELPPSYDTFVASEVAPYVFERKALTAMPPPPEAIESTSTAKKTKKSVTSKKKNPQIAVGGAQPAFYGSQVEDEAELLVIKASLTKPNVLESSVQEQQKIQLLQKISKLQDIVDQHASEIHRLQNETHKLQRQKDRALLERGHLQQDQARAMQLVKRLQEDRDIATKELEKVVILFVKHAEQQEQVASNHLNTLHEQVIKSKRDTQQILVSQKNSRQKDDDELDPVLQDLLKKVQSETYPVISNLRPSKRIEAEEVDVKYDTDSNLEETRSSRPANETFIEQNQQRLPVITSKPANPHPAPEPVVQNDASAVLVSPTTAASERDTRHNMLSMLSSRSVEELTNWRICLHSLKLPRDFFVSASLAGDTRQLLLVIATRWVKLGRQLLRHEVDSILFPGQLKPSTPPDSVSSATPSRSSTKQFTQSIEQVRLCARSLLDPLHQQYHLHSTQSRETHQQHPTGKEEDTLRVTLSVPNSPTKADVSLTNMMNTNFAAYPVSRYGHYQQQLRDCKMYPELSAEAVATVYALAILQRNLQRFNNIPSSRGVDTLTVSSVNTDSQQNMTQQLAEVSVFLQGLKQGKLPAPSLSRDNLRDFIAHQLGLELSWEDYDSVAQRIDKDRSGFIHFPELFRAFASLHPMAQTMSLTSRASINNHTAPPSSRIHSDASPEALVSTALMVQLLMTLLSEQILQLAVIPNSPLHAPATTNNEPTSLDAFQFNASAPAMTDEGKGITLGESWLRFFTQKTHYRASEAKFKRFLARLENLRQTQAQQGANQAEIFSSYADRQKQNAAMKKKSTRLFHQDQGLVSALLLEGSHDGIDLLQRVLRILPELKKRHFQRLRTSPSETTAGALDTGYASGTVLFGSNHRRGNKTQMQEDNASRDEQSTATMIQLLQQCISLLAKQHPAHSEEFTLLTAHGCNMYALADDSKNTEEDVLNRLAQCLATIWQVRYHALCYLEQGTTRAETVVAAVTTGPTATSTSASATSTPPPPPSSSRLSTFQQKLSLVSVANPHLLLRTIPPSTQIPSTAATAEDEVSPSQPRQQWDFPRLQQSEESLADLLGLPVLGTCCDHGADLLQSPDKNSYFSIDQWPRLHRYQVYIEALLSDIHHIALGLDRDLMLSNEATLPSSASSESPDKKKKKKTMMMMSAKTSAVLSDLQRTLHAELWGDGTPSPRDTNPSRPQATLPQRPPPHTVSDVDETLAHQHTEQLTKYLDVLNHRAKRKKQMLSSLLSLWNSAKLVLKEPRQSPPGGASVTLTERERDRDRVDVLQTKSEIIQQTRSIQNVLWRDMQRPEPTKIVLLEDRVALLRQCVENGDIVDVGGALQQMCEEVDAMRASLVQADHDAMRLAARILQHLDF